jgi:ribosomal protein S18 acetylase RimI-like enzyme
MTGLQVVDDASLLERNLRGLATLIRLVGRCAGTVIELGGAVGSLVADAPDYPWLNALVCEPGADFGHVLKEILTTPELSGLAVWACGSAQEEAGREAGFSELVARAPAMSMELEGARVRHRASEPITPGEAGAVSDLAYGNEAHEIERTLARVPSSRVRACGRRDSTGHLVAAAVLLDVGGDCSVQYVATRPDAQRLGHGAALLSDALAQARLRGCITTSLQSSPAGLRLYRRLGYRMVGQLELLRRAPGRPTSGLR